MRRTLRGLSEIRGHFQRDPAPMWYVCATPYTLMGMDEWVRGFRYVTWADCFDGAHPRVFVPEQSIDSTFPFETLEEMNNDLLRREQVRAHVKSFGPGRVVMMMFDDETRELASGLDLDLIMPESRLRTMVDDKVEATRIGDRAGVPSVPNVLGRVGSWEELGRLSEGLGPSLVIQTPFGDSGATTYFVSSRAEYDRCAAAIEAEPEVKVMQRIRPKQAAIEACVTRAGTVVGPLLTEIIGFDELTPFKGGWAGNEATRDGFTDEQRRAASSSTARFGDALRDLGYRGYFEIDWLIDQDTGALYLGEVNPRLSGASPLTNLAAFAHADAPLFLFHMLEYSGIDFELDVDRLNQRWSDPDNMDDWSQLIIKRCEDSTVRLTEAPRSGVYTLESDGSAKFRFAQHHRRTVEEDDEAFFLRIPRVSDRVGFADDLGTLVFRGRAMTADGELTDRAGAWIRAIRARFAGTVV